MHSTWLKIFGWLLSFVIMTGCTVYETNINTKATNAPLAVTTLPAQPEQAPPTTPEQRSLTIELDSVQLSELERELGLQFPAGISDLHSHIEYGLHNIAYVRFTAPTQVVNDWFKQATWIKPLSPNNIYAYLDVNILDWWNANVVPNPPNGVIRYTHPQYGTFNAHVLVDTQNDQSTVYLVAVDE